MGKKALTVQDFLRMFPDDDTCLDHLFFVRYGVDPACPKCGEIGKFHRLAKMPAYTCNCGHHLHPMVGTPFLRTRTSLQKWFYAIFLFTTTRNGVAAKELQRQLGVTYKTAWRMAREIRDYMAWVDGDGMLGGPGNTVEADKSFIGGYQSVDDEKAKGSNKTIVLGMVERGGEVIARIIPNRREESVIPHMLGNIHQGSRVITDEATALRNVGDYGFWHETVNHAQKEWARGSAHTNTIEGFWAMVKRTIAGTHIWVSPKHLHRYLGEIEFRWNLRKSPELMFPVLLTAFQRPLPSKHS